MLFTLYFRVKVLFTLYFRVIFILFGLEFYYVFVLEGVVESDCLSAEF